MYLPQIIACASFLVTGLRNRPAQAQEKAENNREGEGKGMDLEEERADEEKGERGAA